jgi:hypothetical protein
VRRRTDPSHIREVTLPLNLPALPATEKKASLKFGARERAGAVAYGNPDPVGLAYGKNLGHADAGHRYLLYEVGRSLRSERIVLHLRLELGVGESPLEVLNRFPHRLVEEH